MKPGLRHLVLAGAIAVTTSFAAAETYTAKVYGSPLGFYDITIVGAGDNGMMTGHGRFNTGSPAYRHAFTMTNQGSRDINRADFRETVLEDSWGGTYHVGRGVTAGGTPQTFPLFWIGGNIAANLMPGGYGWAAVHGGGGQLQVGHATLPSDCPGCEIEEDESHPGVWSRTAASFKRLHVHGFANAEAVATDGIKIVGWGTPTNNSEIKQAVLWSGPNSTGVNITPPGILSKSEALSVDGSQIGGWMFVYPGTSETHACIWNAAGTSVTDLHPLGVFNETRVRCVRNGLQVGTGIPSSTPNRNQAIAWHGNAATWINLHMKLPSAFWQWSSYAVDIDNLGNIVGYIKNPDDTQRRPVIWVRS